MCFAKNKKKEANRQKFIVTNESKPENLEKKKRIS